MEKIYLGWFQASTEVIIYKYKWNVDKGDYHIKVNKKKFSVYRARWVILTLPDQTSDKDNHSAFKKHSSSALHLFGEWIVVRKDFLKELIYKGETWR
jgi:hypothetical protein